MCKYLLHISCHPTCCVIMFCRLFSARMCAAFYASVATQQRFNVNVSINTSETSFLQTCQFFSYTSASFWSGLRRIFSDLLTRLGESECHFCFLSICHFFLCVPSESPNCGFLWHSKLRTVLVSQLRGISCFLIAIPFALFCHFRSWWIAGRHDGDRAQHSLGQSVRQHKREWRRLGRRK